MSRKMLIEALSENLPHLDEPWPVFILTKATKIPRGLTTDVSEFSPGFMIQMDFEFFFVKITCGFTSTFVAICYAT